MKNLRDNLIKAQKDYLKVDEQLMRNVKLLQVHCRKTVAALLKKHGFKNYWSFSNGSFEAGIKAKGWGIDKVGFWVWGDIGKEGEFLEIVKQIASEFYKVTGVKLKAAIPDDFDPRGYHQRDFLLPKTKVKR